MSNPISELMKEVGVYNIYQICNKSKVIAEFIWNELEDDIIRPNFIKLEDCVPNFIKDNLELWLRSRTPPKHREYIDKLLKLIDTDTTKGIIDYSKGLSLTDTLWIKRKDECIKWSDVNLYKNEFDEVISRVAFDGGLYGDYIKTTSPEFGTNGVLPKCWVREKDNEIYLKKGGTSGAYNSGMEPYSECLSSQLLDVLEYDHVKYTIEHFRGKLVSSCKLITNENISMLPIYMLCDVKSITNIIDYYDSIGCVDKLYKMFIFDYLTLNSDRHANNFAVLVNSDTFEPITMAPIYDNGVGMLNYYVIGDSIKEYINRYIPALYNSFESMAKLAKRNLKSSSNVDNLIRFKFDRSQVKGYSDDKITFIEDFIQERVIQFLSW